MPYIKLCIIHANSGKMLGPIGFGPSGWTKQLLETFSFVHAVLRFSGPFLTFDNAFHRPPAIDFSVGQWDKLGQH